ncbi:hypothetical protein ANCDUO_04018 [Ancylostoma duodenale]|uniref:Uncharacterized protein n=1 Tax=Ancylostoma duodenale TaxID=51022 RepID=A0A0C2DSA6_9BILA|nr:hypothetical protein ANCDUO_04018 [Ancylostoma duodenale]
MEGLLAPARYIRRSTGVKVIKCEGVFFAGIWSKKASASGDTSDLILSTTKQLSNFDKEPFCNPYIS